MSIKIENSKFQIEVRLVKDNKELDDMLYQRWLVLRAPVGMARGTETVHYEDSAFNLGATLLVVRSMITQYDIRIINDKSTRVVLTAKNVLDGIGL